jgi:hypothetical protein
MLLNDPVSTRKNPRWLCAQDAQTHKGGRQRTPFGCHRRELSVFIAVSSTLAAIGVEDG